MRTRRTPEQIQQAFEQAKKNIAAGMRKGVAYKGAQITEKTFKAYLAKEDGTPTVIVHQSGATPTVKKKKSKIEATAPDSQCVVMLVKLSDLRRVLGGLQ